MLIVLRRLAGYPSALVGGLVLVLCVALALLAPLLPLPDPAAGDVLARLAPPFWLPGSDPVHLLGTDELGRDTLARLAFGSRVTLAVALGSVLATATAGGLLGLVAGFYRGAFDDVLSRVADWLLSFPTIVFAILLLGMVGPGVGNLILVLSAKGWIPFFRLTRSEVLVEREKAYVEAARAIGKGSLAIATQDIARNVVHSVLVLATLRLGIVALLEASLSFLGFGVSPSVPAWGSMIASGRDYLSVAWWLPTLPGAAILVLVLSVNLFGEGLRDAMDPRLHHGSGRRRVRPAGTRPRLAGIPAPTGAAGPAAKPEPPSRAPAPATKH